MFSRIIINRFKYFGITCGIFAGSIGFLGLNYKYNFEDIKKK